MQATPQNIKTIGSFLDHPECVCLGPDGSVYTGGELGQIYQISPDGTQKILATTGGFTLGVAIDGKGNIHTCDCVRQQILKVTPQGEVVVRASGIEVPNYGVFDAAGNYYFSDSGEYSTARGTGKIYVIRPDDRLEVFHAGPLMYANGLAIDPTGKWLYIVQSTAFNVVRTPLASANGSLEVVVQLPDRTVADGLAFTNDNKLIISCYNPDIVYLSYPDGKYEVLVEDWTRELLSSPTNIALGGGKLYIANLGLRHVSVMETNLQPAPLHRPML